MVLVVRMASAPATFRHLFAGTNALVPKDISRGLALLTVSGNVNGGKLLESWRPSQQGQHGTATKTLKYWSVVQCQTRGLFGQCRTGGLAVTKQALKPGLSNPFWVPSAGYCDYHPSENIFRNDHYGPLLGEMVSEYRRGIKPGMILQLKAIPHDDFPPWRFVFSLEDGRDLLSGPQFCFCVDLKESGENSTVVFRRGVDDHITVETSFFRLDRDFVMNVHVQSDGFKVYVDNNHFYTMPSSDTNFKKLKFVKVYGHIRIHSFRAIPEH